MRNPARLEILDYRFDIIFYASVLGLPDVVLTTENSVCSSLVIVAWESTTAGIDQQEMSPASCIGNMQMTKGDGPNGWFQFAQQVFQLTIRRCREDRVFLIEWIGMYDQEIVAIRITNTM